LGDFRQRTQAAVQILKVRGVIGGARRGLLVHQVDGPPKSAIIAEVE
jgi:hypothetical protein